MLLYGLLATGQIQRQTATGRPYIAALRRSTRRHVPEADHKIAFDKFHVAKQLGDAVDRVRRNERKELRAETSGLAAAIAERHPRENLAIVMVGQADSARTGHQVRPAAEQEDHRPGVLVRLHDLLPV